jgi:HK97 family phage prohead protease
VRLIGHAAVFNSLSTDLGGFRERIAPGAFARTLRDGHPIYAVHYHDFADLLGSTKSGTLKLSEDAHGLRFELSVPDTSLGRDVHTLVRRGDLVHMSFSFYVNGAAGERWEEMPDGSIERTLLDVTLLEVSTVALPAYPASSVSARAQMRAAAQSTRNRMAKRLMQARLKAVA